MKVTCSDSVSSHQKGSSNEQVYNNNAPLWFTVLSIITNVVNQVLLQGNHVLYTRLRCRLPFQALFYNTSSFVLEFDSGSGVPKVIVALFVANILRILRACLPRMKEGNK